MKRCWPWPAVVVVAMAAAMVAATAEAMGVAIAAATVAAMGVAIAAATVAAMADALRPPRRHQTEQAFSAWVERVRQGPFSFYTAATALAPAAPMTDERHPC
jgi:hypothetical protein